MNHAPDALILAINSYTRSLFLTAAMTVSLLWHSDCFPAELYKWVDDKGQVHYSDSVPPDAINKKRDVIDNKGIVVDKIGAAKTKAQLEEEARREQLEAIKQARLNARRQHDQMLLQTYNNESDLLQMRDRKLSAINDTITLNRNRIGKLKEDLDPIKNRIATLQKDGKEIPDDLQARAKALEDHIVMRTKIIKQYRDQQDRLREQFQQDLERFKYLTENQGAAGQQVNSESGSPPPHL